MPRTIYLHGFASSPASKKAAIFRERFAGLGLPLVVPDLAEGDFRGLTISGQLRVVEREARGEAARLIGSSLGGYLAALYAARHPEVERIVLLAPAFGFARRWQADLGEAQVRGWRESGAMTVKHYGTGGEAELGWRLMEDALQYEDEPDAQQPALIFHGIHDDVVPVEASRAYARGRGNVTLREVSSDHELLDVVESIWAETRAFLGG